MASKNKTRQIYITQSAGAFTTLFKRFSRGSKDFDFEGLSALRKVLSNEKARILHVIKSKNPSSIYQLAKLLGRDFKSVREDALLLQRFGFIDFTRTKKGNRESLKPILEADSITIEIKV